MVIRTTRSISWIKAARKDFEAFPSAVQIDGLRALTVAAEETPKREIDLVHERLKRLKEVLR